MAEPFLELDVQLTVPGFELDLKLTHDDSALVLFGPSGAGKSLLLQVIAGLVRPQTGRVALGGKVLFDAARRRYIPPQKRQIGMVFQHYALFPHLTVEQNLAFGLPGARRGDRRVAQLAQTLRLTHLLHKRPPKLSGGEKQRVAVGRALLPEPALLLLDEPFSALDSTRRERLRWDLKELTNKLGIPLVLVTHDLEEAYLMGDRLAIINAGRVLQAGSRDEVLFKPRSPLVAKLTAVRNLFTAKVQQCADAQCQVQVGATFLRVPELERNVDDEVLLGIRPEHIRVIRPERRAGKQNLLEATIVTQLFTGLQHQLFFRLHGWDEHKRFHLRGTIPDHPYRALGLAVGKQVLLSLPPERLQVLE